MIGKSSARAISFVVVAPTGEVYPFGKPAARADAPGPDQDWESARRSWRTTWWRVYNWDSGKGFVRRSNGVPGGMVRLVSPSSSRDQPALGAGKGQGGPSRCDEAIST